MSFALVVGAGHREGAVLHRGRDAVDRAVVILRRHGLSDFMIQAGLFTVVATVLLCLLMTLGYFLEAAAAANKPKGEDAEEEDKSVWRVLVAEDDPIKGPKDAPVTMIIFSEFQCPFCKRVKPTMDEIEKENPSIKGVLPRKAYQERDYLLALTPQTYIGIAPQAVRHAL